jgi:hypothetical protein
VVEAARGALDGEQALDLVAGGSRHRHQVLCRGLLIAGADELRAGVADTGQLADRPI